MTVELDARSTGSADCPACGVDTTNVQGLHVCPDCDWTQTRPR